MIVTESLWLDDNTFIVDGKKMTKSEVDNLTQEPKKVCMSPENKFLITEVMLNRRTNEIKYKILTEALKK